MSSPTTTRTPAPGQPPRLLDHLTAALQQRGPAFALVHAYREWVRRYIFFHGVRHPVEMGPTEVAAFLEYLVGPGEGSLFVTAQANQALQFLNRVVSRSKAFEVGVGVREEWRVASGEWRVKTEGRGREGPGAGALVGGECQMK